MRSLNPMSSKWCPLGYMVNIRWLYGCQSLNSAAQRCYSLFVASEKRCEGTCGDAEVVSLGSQNLCYWDKSTGCQPLPLGFACCHPLPTLALLHPVSPLPNAWAWLALTGSCSISYSSRPMFSIHRCLESPGSNNYRLFLHLHISNELSQCSTAPIL